MVICIQQYLYFRQFKEALRKSADGSQNLALFQPFVSRIRHGFNARKFASLAAP
jgi:hypothetical protein